MNVGAARSSTSRRPTPRMTTAAYASIYGAGGAVIIGNGSQEHRSDEGRIGHPGRGWRDALPRPCHRQRQLRHRGGEQCHQRPAGRIARAGVRQDDNEQGYGDDWQHQPEPGQPGLERDRLWRRRGHAGLHHHRRRPSRHGSERARHRGSGAGGHRRRGYGLHHPGGEPPDRDRHQDRASRPASRNSTPRKARHRFCCVGRRA